MGSNISNLDHYQNKSNKTNKASKANKTNESNNQNKILVKNLLKTLNDPSQNITKYEKNICDMLKNFIADVDKYDQIMFNEEELIFVVGYMCEFILSNELFFNIFPHFRSSAILYLQALNIKWSYLKLDKIINYLNSNVYDPEFKSIINDQNINNLQKSKFFFMNQSF